MKCKGCRRHYAITDFGAECDVTPNKVIGRQYKHGEYNYADGLCILCHDNEKQRQEELDALLNPDNEPPF